MNDNNYRYFLLRELFHLYSQTQVYTPYCFHKHGSDNTGTISFTVDS